MNELIAFSQPHLCPLSLPPHPSHFTSEDSKVQSSQGVCPMWPSWKVLEPGLELKLFLKWSSHCIFQVSLIVPLLRVFILLFKLFSVLKIFCDCFLADWKGTGWLQWTCAKPLQVTPPRDVLMGKRQTSGQIWVRARRETRQGLRLKLGWRIGEGEGRLTPSGQAGKLGVLQGLLDFLDGSDGKDSACSVGDLGSIPVRKIPWRRKWQPTPVFLPGEFHG